MIQTIHNSRPATIYLTDTYVDTVYAVYDDNDDVFFHVEIDDPSLDVREELEKEFDDETVRQILAEI